MAEVIELAYLIISSDVAYITAQQALFPNGYPHSPRAAKVYTGGFPLVGEDIFTLDTPPFISSIGPGMLGQPLGRAIHHGGYDTGAPTLVSLNEFATADVDSGNTSLYRGDGIGGIILRNDANIFWDGFTYPTPGAPPQQAFPFQWVGYFLVQGGGAVAGTPEAIRERRWIRGFEIPEGGEGGSTGSSLGNMVSRDASRTPEGFGLALRNKTAITTMTLTEFRGGGASTFRGSWERIYMRLRGNPIGSPVVWRVGTTAGATQGAAIKITPTGDLQAFNINGAGTFTQIGATIAGFWALNTWVILDLIVEMSAGAGGRLRVFKNRTQVIDQTVLLAAQGLGSVGFHSTSEIGNTTAAFNLEMDFDDWVNAEIPAAFTGLDWINGSHIARSRVVGFDASHSVNWVGDFRALLQNPAFVSSTETLTGLTSSTSTARMAATADALIRSGQGWAQQGVAAFLVSQYGNAQGAADGQVGYKIGISADVLETKVELASDTWNGTLYHPSGMTTPTTVLPLVFLRIKGADAAASTSRMLEGAMEYLGTFGEVDSGVPGLPDVGHHNAPYVSPTGVVNSGGASGAPPVGTVITESGTYVGNGTGQDINTSGPIHFLYIRALTGSSGGCRWWSSMIGPHRRVDIRSINTVEMIQALVDDSGQAKFRVAGTDPQCNAAGVTYQWVAMSDPAMRFCLNGDFFRDATLVTAAVPLVDTSFTPEGAFVMQEGVGETGGQVSGMWYKGVGHGINRASLLDAAENANALTFATGSIIASTPLLTADRSDAFSLWRTTEPCRSGSERVCAITSYVGDGNASQVITLNLNGRRPLIAILIPHNGGSFVRDPSHTVNDCSTWTLDGIDTTRIIAGTVNQITVGSGANTVGILYDVFVLAGDDGGSGWSGNGAYYPVAPASACGSQWPPNPEPTPPAPTPGSACPIVFPSDLA